MVVAVLLAIIAVVFLYEQNFVAQPSHPSNQDLWYETLQDNPAFALALQEEGQGDYGAGAESVKQALASAAKSDQMQLLAVYLGVAYGYAGDYQNAVTQLEQVVATNSDTPDTRAFAAEQLALAYSRNPAANSVLAMLQQPAYKSLYVATSTNLTARGLFLYATAIKPLPLSEYNIANTFATSIFNQSLVGTTSPAGKAQFASLEQKLKNRLLAGDAALATLDQVPYPSYEPEAQALKALVLGKLQIMGDTSLGDASQAYTTALASYALQGAQDGQVRIWYASFLAAAYGTSRLADIESVLAPIYQDPTHRGVTVVSTLQSYVGALNSSSKRSLATLAAIDPQFRTFLQSLGWTAKDFSATIVQTSTTTTK